MARTRWIELAMGRRGKIASIGIALAMLLMGLMGCSESDKPKAGRAAYYWKTVLRWEKADSVNAASLGLSTLYIRYFDVALVDNKILPVAPVQNLGVAPQGLRIVPVVYMTLEALEAISDSSASVELATHIVKMVTRLHRPIGKPFDELQIDCDWTASSRDRYFRLLHQIKKQTPARLSVTIRLHQVKFVRKTGFPPVDKGMLMVYNMGHPGKTDGRNSIIDAALVESYVKSLGAYPLPLDYAFPLFSWAALFRGDKLTGLLRDKTEEELEECPALKKTGDHAWTAMRSGRLGNVRLWRGDRIRFDASGVDEVLGAARKVHEKATLHPGTLVSVFSWDSLQIERFGKGNIGRIYEEFE